MCESVGRANSLFKNWIFGSSRGNEAQTSTAKSMGSEPPHDGCYIFTVG